VTNTRKRTWITSRSGLLAKNWADLDRYFVKAVLRIRGVTDGPSAEQLRAACQQLLPDEPPWWVNKPEPQPLYTWMLQLYRDGG
jgi:hypothetical protein